jgi:YtkA-like protein
MGIVVFGEMPSLVTGAPLATQTVNDLTVKLSSPGGQLKNGDDDVLIEFRDSRGQLIEVGNVKFEINMKMPGMQMHEGATVLRTGTAGQYRAKIKVGMAGDWTAKLSYEGPRGSGQTSFNLNTKS